jgi:hypothetical protein
MGNIEELVFRVGKSLMSTGFVSQVDLFKNDYGCTCAVMPLVDDPYLLHAYVPPSGEFLKVFLSPDPCVMNKAPVYQLQLPVYGYDMAAAGKISQSILMSYNTENELRNAIPSPLRSRHEIIERQESRCDEKVLSRSVSSTF